MTGPSDCSPTAHQTERIVEEAKARALHVLRENWTTVQETAHALIEQETLSGVALDAVLSTVVQMEMGEIPLSGD